uniref:THAP-type domain-containing protein n=1 Tax=Panagrellus redivivus TaxID=6233 RepID=A0A7E4UNJ1_PANRE
MGRENNERKAVFARYFPYLHVIMPVSSKCVYCGDSVLPIQCIPFPRKEKREAYRNALGIGPDKATHTRSRLCLKHFEIEDIDPKTRAMVRPNALPKVNPECPYIVEPPKVKDRKKTPGKRKCVACREEIKTPFYIHFARGEKRKRYKRALGLGDDVSIHSRTKLCLKHFEQGAVRADGRRFIIAVDALPSMNCTNPYTPPQEVVDTMTPLKPQNCHFCKKRAKPAISLPFPAGERGKRYLQALGISRRKSVAPDARLCLKHFEEVDVKVTIDEFIVDDSALPKADPERPFDPLRFEAPLFLPNIPQDTDALRCVLYCSHVYPEYSIAFPTCELGQKYKEALNITTELPVDPNLVLCLKHFEESDVKSDSWPLTVKADALPKLEPTHPFPGYDSRKLRPSKCVYCKALVSPLLSTTFPRGPKGIKFRRILGMGQFTPTHTRSRLCLKHFDPMDIKIEDYKFSLRVDALPKHPVHPIKTKKPRRQVRLKCIACGQKATDGNSVSFPRGKRCEPFRKILGIPENVIIHSRTRICWRHWDSKCVRIENGRCIVPRGAYPISTISDGAAAIKILKPVNIKPPPREPTPVNVLVRQVTSDDEKEATPVPVIPRPPPQIRILKPVNPRPKLETTIPTSTPSATVRILQPVKRAAPPPPASDDDDIKIVDEVPAKKPFLASTSLVPAQPNDTQGLQNQPTAPPASPIVLKSTKPPPPEDCSTSPATVAVAPTPTDSDTQ